MADAKISALTSSTTPLAGTEVLPIVQSGSTVKVSVADLTAGRAIKTTGVIDTNGNNLLTFSTTASAVNYLTYANAATGNAPKFTAAGSDTNIDITFVPKNTGVLQSYTGGDAGVRALGGTGNYVTVFAGYGNTRGIIWGNGGATASFCDFYDAGAGADRGRFDEYGRFLVGYTSAVAGIPAGSIGAVGYITKKGTSGGLNTNGNTFNISWADGLTGAHLWVDSSDLGQITTSSDYRIKKNIVDQDLPALDRVMQLRTVKYELADYGTLFKADGVKREGFIAHELQAVIPSAVDGEKDAENQIQSLRLDALCSVLTKAIQELKTENDSMKALLKTAGIAGF